MKAVLDIAVPVVTAFIMTIVGLDLARADLERVVSRPGVVLGGLLGPLFFLPPIALLVLAVVPMPEEVGAGLLLLAVCPIGGISNAYNYLARAVTALSVTLTGLSCLAAVVTMPLLTHFFEMVRGRPFGFRAPVPSLMLQILGLLVLPVALGMTVRSRAPRFTARYQVALKSAAFGSLGLLLAFILWREWGLFLQNLAAITGASALFVGLAMAAGLLVARGVGADRRERFTLSVEFATRNCAVAVAVAITILGNTRFAIFATNYFFTEAVMVGLLIAVFRARSAPNAPPALAASSASESEIGRLPGKSAANLDGGT